MATELRADDIREVLNYIDRIKDYEQRKFNRMKNIINLIWGDMFLIAGILDFLLSSHDLYNYTGVPWGLGSISGLLLMSYIGKNRPKEILTQEVKASTGVMNKINKMMIIITLLGWVALTAMVSLFQLYSLIMPFVAILIGTTMIVFNFKYRANFKQYSFFSPKNEFVFMPLIAYISAAVNIIGYAINTGFIIYIGLITGGLIGSAFIIHALIS